MKGRPSELVLDVELATAIEQSLKSQRRPVVCGGVDSSSAKVIDGVDIRTAADEIFDQSAPMVPTGLDDGVAVAPALGIDVDASLVNQVTDHICPRH
jgi:hypothetical protein